MDEDQSEEEEEEEEEEDEDEEGNVIEEEEDNEKEEDQEDEKEHEGVGGENILTWAWSLFRQFFHDCFLERLFIQGNRMWGYTNDVMGL